MNKPSLMKLAKLVTGIALLVLLVAQYALFRGPVNDIAELGHTAAASNHVAEFAGIFVLNVFLSAALPLVFGAIGICVLMAYCAFERMQEREAQDQIKALVIGFSCAALLISLTGCDDNAKDLAKMAKEGTETSQKMAGKNRPIPRIEIAPGNIPKAKKVKESK
jgi:hypothetical protein